MRAGHGADDVEGVIDIRHPHAHGLVERVLERLRARLDLHHLRPQQVHPVDVLALAGGIDGAHVHRAVQPVAGRHRGRGHAVLAGTGFGDQPGLAHAAGHQGLADGVVDLVCTGMVEIFPLEVDLRPAQQLRPAPGVIDRAGPAHEMGQLVTELGLEIGVVAEALIGLAQLRQGADQRFGHEQPAIRAEVPRFIGEIVGNHRHRSTFGRNSQVQPSRRAASARRTASMKCAILTASFSLASAP